MDSAKNKKLQKEIDGLSQIEMARLHRFAPCGHKYFTQEGGVYDYFEARLKKLGGITPTISKQIGWEGLTSKY